MIVERATSAGGVVLWGARDNIEVLLCANHRRGVRALPKEPPDPVESVEETARCEVQEETGLEVEVKAEASSIKYWFVEDGVRYHKKVFFLDGAERCSLEKHDPEFDLVEWASLLEA